MGKDNFIKNTIILTVSNSTMGVLRFIFSIILSKVLGSEGMGLFTIVMPIYDLFCCLVCGGLIAAISKEGAVYYDRGDYRNLNNSISATFYFDLIWSIIIALSVFAFSPFISTYIIKDSRALYSIQVICPALVFVALSAIIKGYFYSMSQVTVPAIIDIVEKAIRISVVVGIIYLLKFNDITKTVTVVYISLSAGEFISFALLYTYYKIYKRKFSYSSHPRERKSQLLFNILVIAIPLCINGFLSTAISSASTLIVPIRLVTAGLTHSDALSIIGKFTGMALNITMFPIIVISSLAIVLVPDISQRVARKDYYGLQKRIETVMRYSTLIGVATMIICLCIPNSLGKLFFNRTDLGSYISFAALSTPFIYASVTSFSILSGLGKQKVILRNSLLTSVQELILLYILAGIPSINIYGYGISLTITCLTSLILNMIEIRSSCYINFSPSKITIDVLCSILVYLALAIFNNIIPSSSLQFKTIFIIITGFLLYFTLIFISDKNTV